MGAPRLLSTRGGTEGTARARRSGPRFGLGRHASRYAGDRMVSRGRFLASEDSFSPVSSYSYGRRNGRRSITSHGVYCVGRRRLSDRLHGGHSEHAPARHHTNRRILQHVQRARRHIKSCLCTILRVGCAEAISAGVEVRVSHPHTMHSAQFVSHCTLLGHFGSHCTVLRLVRSARFVAGWAMTDAASRTALPGPFGLLG